MKKALLAVGIVGIILIIILAGKITVQTVEKNSVDALRTMPYLTWVPTGKDRDKFGVTANEQGAAFKGINIYSSRHESSAHLVDMSGKILHTWAADLVEGDTWNYVEMYKNGDLLAIVKDYMLVKLDLNSNILWVHSGQFHHDFEIAENGDIFALARKSDYALTSRIKGPILNDYIVVLSPEGKLKREISLFDILENEIPDDKAAEINALINNRENTKELGERMDNEQLLLEEGEDHDLFHTNNVEVISRDIEGVCKKGDLLISMRHLNLVAILDIETEKLVWKWGPGEMDWQNHPTLLDNGNILIFDNGRARGYSRIVEINPLTKEIVWQYLADPPQDFYAPGGGSNQRLPNGNTLIADRARAFEVTPDGRIVWEYFNPAMKKKNKRASLYRFMRITNPEDYSCLEGLY